MRQVRRQLSSSHHFRAFEERIAETEAARRSAEETVELTNMEIDSLDHNIKTIKTAIREQGNPMKVGDGVHTDPLPLLTHSMSPAGGDQAGPESGQTQPGAVRRPGQRQAGH